MGSNVKNAVPHFEDLRESLNGQGGSIEVVIWGSGTPRREFLHVDDRTEACVMLASQNDATYAKQIGAWRYPAGEHRVNIG